MFFKTEKICNHTDRRNENPRKLSMGRTQGELIGCIDLGDIELSNITQSQRNYTPCYGIFSS